MIIFGQVDTKNYAWRLDIAQKVFMNSISFSCLFFCSKNCPNTPNPYTTVRVTKMVKKLFIRVAFWQCFPELLFHLDQNWSKASSNMFYYKQTCDLLYKSCQSTGKKWCFINIFTDLTTFSTTSIRSYSFFRRVKFSS